MEKLVKTVRALSDATRLRILNIISERECCVCEVMQVLNISQTRASRNLGILESAGFLKSRRNGAWTYYSLDGQTDNDYARSLVKTLRGHSRDESLLVEDRERLKTAVRLGSACCQEKSV